MEGSSVDSTHHEIARLVISDEQRLPPEGEVVPVTLPKEMREQGPRLAQEDFDNFFDVEDKREQLAESKVTPTQLVAMHLRSFYNVLEYDLDAVQELRDRYVRIFGNVLADILEICYPRTTNYVVSVPAKETSTHSKVGTILLTDVVVFSIFL